MEFFFRSSVCVLWNGRKDEGCHVACLENRTSCITIGQNNDTGKIKSTSLRRKAASDFEIDLVLVNKEKKRKETCPPSTISYIQEK